MEKGPLLNYLKLLRPALGGKTAIKGLDCFQFKGNTILAYNGALATMVQTDFDLPFTGWVNGSAFVRLLSELPENVDFAVVDNLLLVKSGRSRTKFPILQLEHELFTPPTPKNEFIVPIEDPFYEGLEICSASLATSFGSAGIGILVRDGLTSMFSTNMSIYCRYMYEVPSLPPEEDIQILLPAMFCGQLELISKGLSTLPNKLSIDEKYIKATFDNINVYCSFMNEAYKPGYSTLFSEYDATTPTVLIPEGFGDAIKRAEIVASENPVVTLKYDGSTLEINAIYNGDFTEDFDMEYPISGKVVVPIKSLKTIMGNGPTHMGFNEDNCVIFKGNKFMYILAGKA